jgi:glyoxylase-like metal-dependent hydrolase (beta-lactamase superfamily II)
MNRRSLDAPVEGLLATPPSQLPYQANVLIRSYVLERDDGNAIVYNSPGVTAAADDIRALGTPTRLLINHAHEAMYGDPSLDVPVFVHERDRAETGRSMRVSGTFDQPQVIGDDLEVIPTPGHTPGTTSYLWDNGVHRFLFTGDFVWIEEGEWKAVVLDPGLRSEYLASLAIVRDLDFDVLVPWGATDDGPPVALTDRDDARERIDAIIARVSAGGDR